MPPNILLIVAEDSGRLFGCYGNRYAATPHVDGLAADGCRFDQAWSTAPVCAPSRSSIITGQHPIKIGTHHMRSRLLRPPRLFTQELRDAGYFVSWPGKTDFNFEPPAGFCDDTEPWEGRLERGELPRKPWLLYTNLTETHESGMWPVGEERGGGVVEARAPRISDPGEAPVPPYLPDEPAVRGDVARHHDNLAVIDGRVGRILRALRRSGEEDDTVVIFLADHGRGLPREKRWCYPAGLHMPLLVRAPGLLRPGSVDDRLVSWVDVAPTILSIAGIRVPDAYDGASFLDTPEAGAEAAGPDAERFVYAARDRMDEAFDRVRCVGDGRWHYIRNGCPGLPYAQRISYMENMESMRLLRDLHHRGLLKPEQEAFMAERKPPEELYDLQTDPHCLRNLAADPGRGGVRRRLAAALEAWLREVDDRGAIPERQLIDDGLVEDRLGSYAERIEPLPSPLDRDFPLTVLEMPEAAADPP